MNISVIASGSDGNCTKVSDGQTSLLFDIGINIKRLLIGTSFTLSDTAGCFITHEHLDHAKAAKSIAHLGVNVYASQGTLSTLGLSGHRYHVVTALKTVCVDSFIVLPFDVTHDAVEPLGFLLESTATDEKLIYFSDTAYVKYTFSGLTHIIAECNYSEAELRQNVRDNVISTELAKRIVKNHMSIQRLIDFIKSNDKTQLKEIHLIHLSNNNSNPKMFKEAIQRITRTPVYIH